MRSPNLVLLGFMGTGKTAVAAAVSRLFGLPMVDTDAMIEAANGLSPAALIRGRGEEIFRELEAAAVREAAALEGHVIATGGGVPLRGENLAALGRSGVLVLLTATSATLSRRLRGEGDRPLLCGDAAEDVAAQLEARREAYARVPHRVATDGRDVDALAREVYALWLRHRGAAV